MSDALYREQILDLYKHPLNRGKLDGATHVFCEFNPLCGDKMTMQLLVKDNKVLRVMFEGDGCAISTACASLLTEKLRGMSLVAVKKLSKSDVLDLLGVELSPTRLKCALLPLEGVKHALEGKSHA